MPLFHLMRNPSRGRERAVRHSSNGASLFSRALRVSQIQFPRYYFYDNRAPFNCYPRVYLLFSRHLSNSVHQVNVWYAVCLLHSCGVVSHIPTSRRIHECPGMSIDDERQHFCVTCAIEERFRITCPLSSVPQ